MIFMKKKIIRIIKEEIKCFKMTETEFCKKFYNLNKDVLNIKYKE